MTTHTNTPSRTSEQVTDSHVAELTTAIKHTRGEMSQTIEKLHGRLNPRILKQEALEQFREAKDAIKVELRADVQDAKDAVRAGLAEAKESLRAELVDTKDQLTTGLKEGVSDAKVAIRDATIGKVETMVHNTQETVKTASRSLVSAVTQNPIPAAMVGVGLVWFIASSRSKQPSNGQPATGRTAAAVADAGESIKTGAMELSGSIKDKAIGLAHDARDMTKSAAVAVGDAAHAAADKVTHLASGAAAQGRRLGHRAEGTYMGNPLAVGAVVLAAGVAVGLAIPSSEIENKLMGETRDGVLGKAEALAGEALDGLDETAKKITAAAEAAANGKTPDDEVDSGDNEKTPTAPRPSYQRPTQTAFASGRG